MGLATTPACFMSTIEKGYMYDGALMCTASHLPWNRNGGFATADCSVRAAATPLPSPPPQLANPAYV